MVKSRYAVPTADDLGEVTWRKSRRSNSTGNCVEFAEIDGGRRVAVRDSRTRTARPCCSAAPTSPPWWPG